MGRLGSPFQVKLSAQCLQSRDGTCCICRDGTQGIIIHHLVPWSEIKNHDENNLVVLCLHHHDEAHTQRSLSLSLTVDRIRAIRNLWYSESEGLYRDQLRKVIDAIRHDHRRFTLHRGAERWGGSEGMLFGNDNYGHVDEEPQDPRILRTRLQVKLIRAVLFKEETPELAFAVTRDGVTWGILVRSSEPERLSRVVSACFLVALESSR